MTDAKATRLSEIKPDLRIPALRTLEMLAHADAHLAVTMRRQLFAYGYYQLDDGVIVVYNRSYEAMFESTPAGGWKTSRRVPPVSKMDHQEWFYTDGDSEPEKRRKSIEGMRKIGLIG